jgi:putative ABC transport system permease protein
VLLRVATRPGMQASAAIQTVFDQLRRDPTITVAQPVQQINFLFRIVSSIDQVLLAMALVVMISAAVSILLSLYNSMDQRRRQIAVLRVLGASGGRIFGLVMTESAIIGLAGAALGVGLSYLVGLAVSRVMFERLGLLIEPSYGAEWLLAVVVAAVLLSAMAGLAPALRAYRTSVAEHLKPAA